MIHTLRNYVAAAILALVALVVGVLAFGFETTGAIVALVLAAWAASRLWSLFRLWQSVNASRGNEAAMAMETVRFKASLFRFLFNLVVLPAFAVVAWLCLRFGMGGTGALAVASICTVLAGLPVWSKAEQYRRRYKEGFKESFVTAALSGVFDNLKYEPAGEFDPASLAGLDFFEHFDRYGSNDLIDAVYKGIHFVQGDVRVEEHYTVTREDSNGDTHQEDRWRTAFFGRAMRFDFADAFRGPVQVVQKDFPGAKVRSAEGWRRVETELAEFALDFDVYARDPVDAMAALTPPVVEGIFYLYHKLASPVAFSFAGNAMFAFLPLARDSFDVSEGRTLLEERKLLEQDISFVTGFLDTMYFKRRPIGGGDSESVPAPEREAFVRSPAVEAARLRRTVAGGTRTVFRYVFYVVFAGYLFSLVYAFGAFGSGISLGFSYRGGEFSMHGANVPILVYILAINGFFVLPFAVKACLFSRSLVASIVQLMPMAIHFLILHANAAYA